MALCNQKFSFEEVQEMRRAYETGEATVRQIAERFKVNLHYVYDILHGEVRQYANTRKPKPIIQPMNTRERITDSRGNSFLKRGRKCRFMRQIPFHTIALMRHAYEQNGMAPSDIAVKFNVSLSYTKLLLMRKARPNE